MSNSLRRVPTTIITGFLGAGKTTIIRNLLENPGKRRLAVIVNEFGDMGFDGEVLKGCGLESCPEENVVELANGCICCTVADDFQPALEDILSRQPPVDHILIETSGLALPKPLVQAFNWPDIRARVTVDGVVAVADGDALARGLVAHDMSALDEQRAADDSLDHDNPVEEVFEDQIACADLVLLSKADLIDDEAKARALHLLEHSLGASVKVVPVKNGAISHEVLLGLGANVEDEIENRKTHHDGEHDHEHDDFDGFALHLDDIGETAAFVERLEAVGALDDVLRIKGFANIEDKPMRLVVQGVGARVQTHFDRPWNDGEQRGTQLVVIGLHGLDRVRIERLLLA
ncbi:MAG: cobalamin biosynthesis protein CobW [Hyphomicrobiaceae bacterium]|nr:cobalamin biosynthesis protein CobW [Hyphomicrobiaceae bacterium]